MKEKKLPLWYAGIGFVDKVREEDMSLLMRYAEILAKYKGKLYLMEPIEAYNFRQNSFIASIQGDGHPHVFYLMLCYYDWAREREEATCISMIHVFGISFAIAWFILWVILPLFL